MDAEHPRDRKLDEYSEGLLYLGLLGGNFASHAASRLLSAQRCWGETRYWMLRSAFARGDVKTARMFLNDWKAQDRKPKAMVSKFVPGEHYHTLNTKFDTLDEAIEYIRSRGYVYEGLREQHVYKPE